MPLTGCYMQVQVLESVLPLKDDEVVLGQYEGYRDDPTVPDQSNTPTFATVVLRVHNERWEGMREVPAFLSSFVCWFIRWTFL